MTAARGTDLPTLLDLVKAKDPNGAIASVVEYLTQRNSVLEDMVWKEANKDDGELITSRTALPSVTYRRFNEGVTAGKSLRSQATETFGMMAGLSKVDKALADLNGGAAYRMSEDKAFLQSFNNEVENGVIYNSTKTSPEKWMGLAPRLDATSGNPAASQIIKHTGSPSGSDQTSIWFLVWGPETVYGIFPKGSNGGLTHNDMGVELVDDGLGNSAVFPAYRTWWEWKVGLAVRDWRYVVRVCNIDTSALSAGADDLLPKMIDAYYQLQDIKAGRPVIYCNRFIQRMLHKQARYAVGQGGGLTVETVDGREVVKFLGIPVRVSDGILNTEAAVS